MKVIVSFLVFFFMVFSVYSNGNREIPLVNEQNIAFEKITNIEISYRSDEIILLTSRTNSVIIKEYMSINNSNYYSNINNDGNRLSIRRGNRPISLGFFNSFYARIEVYIPEHLIQDVTLTTTSGRIIVSDNFTLSRLNLQTTSGSISNNSVTGNIIAKSTSGSINLGIIVGNVSIESTSGRITIDQLSGSLKAKSSSGSINAGTVNGDVYAETTSGRIYSSFIEINGNISLTSTSGKIELIIPQNSEFNFTARRTSGNLSTPFSERLFSPVSDRRLAQGIIGENNPNNNINIRTTSGSISVQWKI